jgi:hypothetical protein
MIVFYSSKCIAEDCPSPRPEFFRSLLAMTQRFDDAVFSNYSARQAGIAEVLREGMPEEQRPVRAYLRYLIAQREIANAAAVWGWMNAHHLGDEKITIEYCRFLVGEKHYEEGAEAWRSRMGERPDGYGKAEFVYNGDFRAEPREGALFDWNVAPVDHVEMAREYGGQPAGWSLRIRFDGSTNLDFRGISEKMVLRQGKYRLRASVRADKVTTDQGVFFRVSDEGGPGGFEVETEPVLRSSEWRTIEKTFAVGPGAHLATVSVLRRPSLRFDSKINGTVWIGRVSVVRE